MGNLITYVWPNKLMFKQKVRILMVGLDTAGKTTILNKIKNTPTPI